MDFMTLMGGISAGTKAISGIQNLFGGGLSQKAALEAGMNRNNKQFHTTLKFTGAQADKDRALQEKFARQSTGWQFDDLMNAADEAGIHRLSALGGASGHSFAPVGATAPAPPYDGMDIAALSGSSVGEGLGLIGEAANSMINHRLQQEDAKRQDARDQVSASVAASEIMRNQAEAEMLLASRSRTLIDGARELFRSGSKDPSSEDDKYTDKLVEDISEMPELDQVPVYVIKKIADAAIDVATGGPAPAPRRPPGYSTPPPSKPSTASPGRGGNK